MPTKTPAAPTLIGLRSTRTTLMGEIEGLRNADGTFKSDEARASFDAKMAEVEGIDEQIRNLERTPASTEEQLTAARDAGVQAERTRISEIRKAVRAAKLADAVGDDLIARGVTLDVARSEVLAKLAARSDEQIQPNGNHPHIELGADARDKFMRGAANWLLIKGGVADMVARSENAQTPPVLDPGEFRGMTLVELCRETLVRLGRNVRGMDKMRLIAEAFTVRAGDITQSTSDFATLLENVMHKVLQAAYATQPDTWTKFCGRGTVSDFRAHNRYRMGSFGALDAVSETGEFKNKAISDGEKATITAATKGNIINVSRQMIVNDDMGSFTRLLSMLGRAAGLSVEVDVYALLAQNAGLGPNQADGQPLFHANRSNVGVGAALSAAALDADAAVMAAQKDPNGNEFIDLQPAVLLLARGLRGQAIVINDSQYDPDTIANKAQMKPNVVRGFFRDIVGTPRLAGTRRYMFADPSIAPVIEVAFLEGQTSPVLETQDGWRTDGAEMKVRFDYGVAAVDFRGAVSNAGA
jgi:hypothetical protein